MIIAGLGLGLGLIVLATFNIIGPASENYVQNASFNTMFVVYQKRFFANITVTDRLLNLLF